MTVAVDFTPTDNLQIVAWLEKTDGTYVDTAYITNKTGRFGLGNRPGIPNFNTGSASNDTWPYGRRVQTFPVWAHRHGHQFPVVIFQNLDHRNLSHPFAQSSPELPPPYGRPIQPNENGFDAGTTASASFTDKGRFAIGSSETDDGSTFSLYPPRSDIERRPSSDSPAVDMFRANNPFDAVSQATPFGGLSATAVWSAPESVDYGDYVLYVEASKTYDFNATYNETTYPPLTDIPWKEYGKAWRGQPSVVYSVPISIASTPTRATTTDYVGYGDPDGKNGTLNPPDATITTTTPGSGASRFQLVSDGAEMYRVRVRATPEFDSTPPAEVGSIEAVGITSTSGTLQFLAPGDDGSIGAVTGYEVRVRVGSPVTDENFKESMPVTATLVPTSPGEMQMVTISGLLPETEYFVGVKAYDNCFNRGPLATTTFKTNYREAPEVPWCFIATAAYGSVMANDVAMLRRFRDGVLGRSVLGELAIETYYTFGPAVAGVIGESDLLRASVRGFLVPIVDTVRKLSY
ncbi:MAG TPA: fibronectin type III domain-containing protein [Kofleriaceae bacterium]|nr:fibronectin type III domain-containing protein [Kofleriaceae bacterium]